MASAARYGERDTTQRPLPLEWLPQEEELDDEPYPEDGDFWIEPAFDE